MIKVKAQPAMQVMTLDNTSPMQLTYQEHEHGMCTTMHMNITESV